MWPLGLSLSVLTSLLTVTASAVRSDHRPSSEPAPLVFDDKSVVHTGNVIDLRAIRATLSLDRRTDRSYRSYWTCPSQIRLPTWKGCLCLSSGGPSWLNVDLHRSYVLRSIRVVAHVFGDKRYGTSWTALLSQNGFDWTSCAKPRLTSGKMWDFHCGFHMARYVRFQVNSYMDNSLRGPVQSFLLSLCHVLDMEIKEASALNLRRAGANLELHVVHRRTDRRHKLFRSMSTTPARNHKTLSVTDGVSLCLPVLQGGLEWTPWLRLDLQQPVGIYGVEVSGSQGDSKGQSFNVKVGFASQMEDNSLCSRANPVETGAASLLYDCNGRIDGVYVDVELNQVSVLEVCLLHVYGAIVDYCSVPDTIRYGYYHPMTKWYRSGSVVSYTCEAGYQLEGSSDVMCTGRSWSRPPRCEETYCPVVQRLPNGVVAVSGYRCGGTASFWCSLGYDLNGLSVQHCVQPVNGNAIWNGTVPRCVGRLCGMPKVPRNGYLNGSDFRHPATVRYGCNIGYVLSSGDTERQCNSKGKWTGWAPACARIRCGFLIRPRNGILIPTGNHVGSTIRVTCHRGFRLLGSKSRLCVVNDDGTDGHWTGTDPTCQAVECPRLNPISYGRIAVDRLVYTATARYSCNDGYGLVMGDVIRQCKATGLWSGQSPVCRMDIPDCGRSCHTHRRIASGKTVKEGEFPWQAMICLYGRHLCGGTLISDNCVVTAAHCVSLFYGNEPDTSVFGVCVGRICGNCRQTDKQGHPQCHDVSRIAVHPKYNNTILENDIAVMKLNGTVQLRCDRVMPICLPDEHRDRNYVRANRDAVVTGWGKLTNQSGFTKCLRKGSVRTVSDSMCKESHSLPVTGRVMCATDFNGPCEGDSGGPLMVRNVEYGRRWVLGGVVSWGKGCGRDDSYGVYTEVLPHVEWILKQCGGD